MDAYTCNRRFDTWHHINLCRSYYPCHEVICYVQCHAYSIWVWTASGKGLKINLVKFIRSCKYKLQCTDRLMMFQCLPIIVHLVTLRASVHFNTVQWIIISRHPGIAVNTHNVMWPSTWLAIVSSITVSVHAAYRWIWTMSFSDCSHQVPQPSF